MKKMKFAFLAACAFPLATAVMAGDTMPLPTAIAREVITDNAQTLSSPSLSFRFTHDVDGRTAASTFQMQYTLDSGALWNDVGDASQIKLADGVSGTPLTQGSGPGQFQVVALALSADRKTLFTTLTVNGVLVQQPIITLAGGTGNAPTLRNLKQVVGDVGSCDTSVKTLAVGIKHYLALSNPQALATDSNATPGEHLVIGARIYQTLLMFPTNLLVAITSSTGNASLSANNNFSAFLGNPGSFDANTGQSWSYVSPTLANLGFISLKQNSMGYDLDLAHQYLLNNNGSSGLSATATASSNAGAIETQRFDVVLNASPAPANGSKLFLSSNDNCSNPISGSNVTLGSSTTMPITLSVGTSQLVNALSQRLYVCYDVSGSNNIPSSRFTVASATLVKAANNPGNPLAEQNNSCSGSLYSLANTIKIDVRNYAANGRTDGWLSVLRIINTSENQTADIYGQYILANGNYGRWGKLLTLAPRATAMVSPQDVADKLRNAPTYNGPAENAAPSADGAAARLRITSDTSDSLRVQNYLFNPISQNFIEASGAQGGDLNGNSQTLSQDAQSGLNGGR
ncbi:hypothetical protein SAMN02745857_03833 [Andreprevotia lacus DSM 23236]|jgi:hypothetical protein|uniref:Uncharacterized protein n=1 Tax=Andreprevotia lacus DSM 23236 TaxID=1121001 RepID=A0A1W1XZY6_9NEIS|nr:hypothetical protein [Andreprevotia lacus]SMC29435.1 hypothetical protein SAMN02745857_03833 [Andreprevotia lacus DSM 23236]